MDASFELSVLDTQLGSAVSTLCRWLRTRGAQDPESLVREVEGLERSQAVQALLVAERHGVVLRRARGAVQARDRQWADEMLPDATRRRRVKALMKLPEGVREAQLQRTGGVVVELVLPRVQRMVFRGLASAVVDKCFGKAELGVWDTMVFAGDAKREELLDVAVMRTGGATPREDLAKAFELLVGVVAIIPKPRVVVAVHSTGPSSAPPPLPPHQEEDELGDSRDSNDDDSNDDDDDRPIKKHRHSASTTTSATSEFLLPRLGSGASYHQRLPHPSLVSGHPPPVPLPDESPSAYSARLLAHYRAFTPSARLGFNPERSHQVFRDKVSKCMFTDPVQVEAMRAALRRKDVVWSVNEAYMVRAHMCHVIARYYADMLNDSLVYEVAMTVFDMGLAPLRHRLFEHLASDGNVATRPFDLDLDGASQALPMSTDPVHVAQLVTRMMERQYWHNAPSKVDRRAGLTDLVTAIGLVCAEEGFEATHHSVRINLNVVLARMRLELCCDMVERLHGKSGRQKFSMLLRAGTFEEHTLVRQLVAQPKDTRHVLHELFQAGFVTMQEVPRGSAYTPSTVTVLWRASVPRAMTEVARLTQLVLRNVFVKYQHEKHLVVALVEEHKRNRHDVAAGDVDDEYAAAAAAATAATVRDVEDAPPLAGSPEHNVEKTVGILSGALHRYLLLCDLTPWSENRFASWERALAAEFGYAKAGVWEKVTQ